ncbi:hypothetical protein SELMODRAFT_403756 [Selaginella moellendorffii]|uniref:Uncharacterized protein n=1 Tax=Selaginella moellendorffii TaxID=88036 RepID=D8QSF4_SELML|nr:hypothetical protein SELMODRAFT_403756 [Selaginella moellendorffii]
MAAISSLYDMTALVNMYWKCESVVEAVEGLDRMLWLDVILRSAGFLNHVNSGFSRTCDAGQCFERLRGAANRERLFFEKQSFHLGDRNTTLLRRPWLLRWTSKHARSAASFIYIKYIGGCPLLLNECAAFAFMSQNPKDLDTVLGGIASKMSSRVYSGLAGGNGWEGNKFRDVMEVFSEGGGATEWDAVCDKVFNKDEAACISQLHAIGAVGVAYIQFVPSSNPLSSVKQPGIALFKGGNTAFKGVNTVFKGANTAFEGGHTPFEGANSAFNTTVQRLAISYMLRKVLFAFLLRFSREILTGKAIVSLEGLSFTENFERQSFHLNHRDMTLMRRPWLIKFRDVVEEDADSLAAVLRALVAASKGLRPMFIIDQANGPKHWPPLKTDALLDCLAEITATQQATIVMSGYWLGSRVVFDHIIYLGHFSEAMAKRWEGNKFRDVMKVISEGGGAVCDKVFNKDEAACISQLHAM